MSTLFCVILVVIFSGHIMSGFATPPRVVGNKKPLTE